jgi:hypothetical protein
VPSNSIDPLWRELETVTWVRELDRLSEPDRRRLLDLLRAHGWRERDYLETYLRHVWRGTLDAHVTMAPPQRSRERER